METEIKTEGAAADTTNGAGEGETKSEIETISIPKSDYEKLNQTLGSLKRELKDFKKSKDDSKEETSKSNAKPDDRVLEKLERMAFRQHGITHEDDMDLARSTAKKWNVDVDDVLIDEDFKVKLERQQTSRSNIEATSKVKGGAGGVSQAKNTAGYWIAKGTPPTAADVPDRKLRAGIAREMMAAKKTGKKFYND